jgi:hypothetical protein
MEPASHDYAEADFDSYLASLELLLVRCLQEGRSPSDSMKPKAVQYESKGLTIKGTTPVSLILPGRQE